MSRFRNTVKNLGAVLGFENYGRKSGTYGHMSMEELNEAIAEDNASIQETEADIDTASDTMDTLAEDQNMVENITEQVDASIESGEGLSEPAAAVVQEAVESVLRRHGMPRRTWPNFPAVESFNGKSRLEATKRLKVSIEKGVWQSIKDGIATIWKRIKEFFQKLWNFITGKGFKLEEKAQTVVENTKEVAKVAPKAPVPTPTVSASDLPAAAAFGVTLRDENSLNDTIKATSELVRKLKEANDKAKKDWDDIKKKKDEVTKEVEAIEKANYGKGMSYSDNKLYNELLEKLDEIDKTFKEKKKIFYDTKAESDAAEKKLASEKSVKSEKDTAIKNQTATEVLQAVEVFRSLLKDLNIDNKGMSDFIGTIDKFSNAANMSKNLTEAEFEKEINNKIVSAFKDNLDVISKARKNILDIIDLEISTMDQTVAAMKEAFAKETDPEKRRNLAAALQNYPEDRLETLNDYKELLSDLASGKLAGMDVGQGKSRDFEKNQKS